MYFFCFLETRNGNPIEPLIKTTAEETFCDLKAFLKKACELKCLKTKLHTSFKFLNKLSVLCH